MSKNETNRITTPGASASGSRSTQKVLDIERRFIDDLNSLKALNCKSYRHESIYIFPSGFVSCCLSLLRVCPARWATRFRLGNRHVENATETFAASVERFDDVGRV